MSAAAATALIQFIGLFVFSTQWSDHLQAIAPRVVHAANMHRAKAHDSHRHPLLSAADVVDTSPGGAAEVETHATIIAFPAEKYVPGSAHGWNPVKLANAPRFLYVRLDGERVTFKDGGAIKGGRKKVGLEREMTARYSTSRAEDLGLPRLTACFKGMEHLKSDYVPGDSGVPRGATAVFDLPNGSARACRAKVKTKDSEQENTLTRIDTVVGLSFAGDLIISAPGKELRVRNDTHVLVANIEASYIDGTTGTTGFRSAPHYDVYFDMGLDNSGAPTDSAYRDLALQAADALDACEETSVMRQRESASSVMRQGYDPNPQSGVPEAFARVDYQCSNSQWP